jgi:hypothetical protein
MTTLYAPTLHIGEEEKRLTSPHQGEQRDT